MTNTTFVIPNYVTVVNRSTQKLSGTWDGKPYDFAPLSETPHVPYRAAKALKSQHPVNGTVGANMIGRKFLLGIKELNDDCSPLEQVEGAELIDPVQLHGEPLPLVKGKGAHMLPGETQGARPRNPGAVEASFEADEASVGYHDRAYEKP